MTTMDSSALHELEQFLDSWLDALTFTAKEAARPFTSAAYCSRDSHSTTTWFRHIVLVREPKIGRRTLSILWYRMRWITYRDGNKKYRGEYLKRGKGYRYPARAFSPVDEQERHLIETREDVFEILRMQVETIGKIRRTLSSLRRTIEKARKESAHEEPDSWF